MTPDEPQHRDRYDTSGNVEAEYVDAEQTVLANKLGITDLAILQVREEQALVEAYEKLLGEVRQDTPLTSDLIRYIHETIFGQLFAWAGRWRTVWIRKPGVTWPPPDFLEQGMQEFERIVLKKVREELSKNDEYFCRAVGEIQGEFLVIHPFREGNARTIKLACDLLAVQTGRPLLRYDESDAGRDQYIEAAKAAFTHRYDAMARLISAALERGRQDPPSA